MPNTLTQAQAQAIVEDHSHSTYVDERGVLMGGILYSIRQDDDSLVVGTEWTPVPLNIPGLRDWLGY